MRLLLDTHVLLWWLADDRRLGDDHRDLISDASNIVLVSAMTVAEIAIKTSLGKLAAPDDLLPTLEAGGFDGLTFESRHAEVLRSLPWHHRDPFDRMLIAQAIAEQLTILTADPHFAAYGVGLR
ncbi:type II toxin-antitoxin system VapC family toxin [Agromyces bauzanensis]|uniref:Twitching motility protein PilT n=1 Tax=Agromyces bauzanensis TaxID=1308924 RepID=A0A917UXP2_9MICO|nr:type II toxin-antitoxin system VapC family toxin [Agromyces bauzanensis]GGJ93798.1 twitching motility protein PilT [Agromyces bauzanensis]